MPSWLKWTLIALGALAVVAILLSSFRTTEDSQDMTFGEVIAAGREGRLDRIEARSSRLEVTLTDDPDDELRSRIGEDTDLIAALQAEGVAIAGSDGVAIEFKRPFSPNSGFAGLLNLVPFVILVLFYFVIRNAVREGMRRARADETRVTS